MGVKGWKQRLTASPQDIERERLQRHYEQVTGLPIAKMPLRRPVRIAGEVTRHRVVPRAGSPWLEVTVSDGTGEVIAAFAGRRRIGGLDPGRGVVLEGVAHASTHRTVILNPAYTLLGASNA
jgi:RecG-like helicase